MLPCFTCSRAVTQVHSVHTNGATPSLSLQRSLSCLANLEMTLAHIFNLCSIPSLYQTQWTAMDDIYTLHKLGQHNTHLLAICNNCGFSWAKNMLYPRANQYQRHRLDMTSSSSERVNRWKQKLAGCKKSVKMSCQLKLEVNHWLTWRLLRALWDCKSAHVFFWHLFLTQICRASTQKGSGDQITSYFYTNCVTTQCTWIKSGTIVVRLNQCELQEWIKFD